MKKDEKGSKSLDVRSCERKTGRAQKATQRPVPGQALVRQSSWTRRAATRFLQPVAVSCCVTQAAQHPPQFAAASDFAGAPPPPPLCLSFAAKRGGDTRATLGKGKVAIPPLLPVLARCSSEAGFSGQPAHRLQHHRARALCPSHHPRSRPQHVDRVLAGAPLIPPHFQGRASIRTAKALGGFVRQSTQT